MNLPKSFIKNRLFEVGRTVITRPRKKIIEFYHKKIAWWIDIYGIRLKYSGYYLILKKICF